MSKETRNFAAILALLALIAAGGTSQANWEDTFNNNTFDLSSWEFPIYPQLPTGNFSATIQDGPDDNDYLALVETNSIAVGGSGFGAAFVPTEQFTDVRVGAVVSVEGDACRNNYVLIGRAAYLIDDGSMSGYPGVIANCY